MPSHWLGLPGIDRGLETRPSIEAFGSGALYAAKCRDFGRDSDAERPVWQPGKARSASTSLVVDPSRNQSPSGLRESEATTASVFVKNGTPHKWLNN